MTRLSNDVGQLRRRCVMIYGMIALRSGGHAVSLLPQLLQFAMPPPSDRVTSTELQTTSLKVVSSVIQMHFLILAHRICIDCVGHYTCLAGNASAACGVA